VHYIAHCLDAPFHAPYHQWWNTVVNDVRFFALSTLVAVGFVRIVTQAKMPGGPTPVAAALAFVDDIIARRNCRQVDSEGSQWAHTSRLCSDVGATGK